MKNCRFSLSEAAVVCLLVASLIVPLCALGQARKQSKAAVCLSRLHHLGRAMSLYCADNSDSYPSWRNQTVTITGELPWSYLAYACLWMNALHPYYSDAEIRCCPEATRILNISPYYEPGATFAAWGMSKEKTFTLGPPSGMGSILNNCWGSFGLNSYMLAYDRERDLWESVNTPTNLMADSAAPGTQFWNNESNTRNSANIPVFCDSTAFQSSPGSSLLTPLKNGPNPDNNSDCQHWSWGGDPSHGINDFSAGRNMWQFCIDRHRGGTQIIFSDGSARKVALPDLWQMKWGPLYVAPSAAAMQTVRDRIATWSE